MGLTATEGGGGGDFELAPQDVYTARCYRIIDLGTQKVEWQGKTKEQHKIMISWELIGDKDPRMQEGDNKGKPFSIHKRYTVTLSEKGALRADLEGWRGKKFTVQELEGFDLSKVLGSYCTIQVVHSEDGKYANVNSIMAYKGDKPKAVNPDLVFDLDNPDLELFELLSDNIKATIMQSPEWASAKPKTAPAPAKTATTAKPVEDVTIEDVEPEQIDLDDIPF